MTTSTDAVQLKPCPFCGNEKVGMNSEHDSDTGGVFLSIKCSGCRASSGAGFSTNECPQTYQEVRDEWNRRAPTAVQAAQAEGVREWQSIETAPRGAIGYYWMNLAWGAEGDVSTGPGMRWGDRFFAAGSFYCLGQEKRYEFREIEVKPTHWMPLPAAPAASAGDKV